MSLLNYEKKSFLLGNAGSDRKKSTQKVECYEEPGYDS